MRVICFSCRGSGKGKHPDNKHCPFCGGSGYEELSKEQAETEVLRVAINKSRRGLEGFGKWLTNT